MSGGGTIDSFKSSLIPGNHQWSLPYRRNNAAIGLIDTTTSDLKGTYVYGNLSYSSSTNTAPKNAGNVGSISSPYTGVSTPAPTPPAGVTWTTYAGGGSNPPNGGSFAVASSGGTTYIKVTGDLKISSGGNPLHLTQYDTGAQESLVIWVTGDLVTSGSGYVQQDSNIKVTYYVAGDVTLSGGSYQNNSGYASNLVINGFGSAGSKVTVSGSSMFTGMFNAPNYDFTISGGGDFSGSLIGRNLTISGGSSLHYDEDIAGTNGSGGYAFASWFEDNSDPARGIIY
jgi:hypothetical protein